MLANKELLDESSCDAAALAIDERVEPSPQEVPAVRRHELDRYGRAQWCSTEFRAVDRTCSQYGSTLYWLGVRIISRRALREFWERHPDAEQPLRAWYHEARRAHWRSPAAIKRFYANASFVANDRV